MPTGGVSLANMAEWFDAGVVTALAAIAQLHRWFLRLWQSQTICGLVKEIRGAWFWERCALGEIILRLSGSGWAMWSHPAQFLLIMAEVMLRSLWPIWPLGSLPADSCKRFRRWRPANLQRYRIDCRYSASGSRLGTYIWDGGRERAAGGLWPQRIALLKWLPMNGQKRCLWGRYLSYFRHHPSTLKDWQATLINNPKAAKQAGVKIS